MNRQIWLYGTISNLAFEKVQDLVGTNFSNFQVFYTSEYFLPVQKVIDMF